MMEIPSAVIKIFVSATKVRFLLLTWWSFLRISSFGVLRFSIWIWSSILDFWNSAVSWSMSVKQILYKLVMDFKSVIIDEWHWLDFRLRVLRFLRWSNEFKEMKRILLSLKLMVWSFTFDFSKFLSINSILLFDKSRLIKFLRFLSWISWISLKFPFWIVKSSSFGKNWWKFIGMTLKLMFLDFKIKTSELNFPLWWSPEILMIFSDDSKLNESKIYKI